MNVEYDEASNHNPSEPAARRPADSGGAKRDDFMHRANEFARRATATAAGLPSQLDGQIRRTPYAVLGVACLLAAGAGVVLSSRILRAVLTATATVTALELTRAVIRREGSRLGTH